MAGKERPLSYSKLASSLPAVPASAVHAYFRRARTRKSLPPHLRPVVCVFDDDPTGIQTVHDVAVILRWSQEAINDAFRSSDLFYIQTNSRGKPAHLTEQINRELMSLCARASRVVGRPFRVISRSDSTLRGHYPLETDVLREEWRRLLGREVDGEIMIPFFLEGGRITVSDVHYVRDGDALIPAAQTEFARDRVFGYASSNLREYIEEKTSGRVKSNEVTSIRLELLRAGDLDAIETALLAIREARRVVVNAVSYDDLRVFVEALARAEEKGKQFLFRSAASFVKVYGYVEDAPLLDTAFFARLDESGSAAKKRGLLVLVGSHVEKSTRQLEQLLEAGDEDPIELDVPRLLTSEEARRSEISSAAARADALLSTGRNAIVYTSRRLATAPPGDKGGDLSVSAIVSSSLSSVAGSISVRPVAVVAKGGITSSDVATEGLRMKRAMVLGQVLPGIPVVQGGNECRWPDIPFIIFPGNVGDTTALRDACRIVRGGASG